MHVIPAQGRETQEIRTVQAQPELRETLPYARILKKVYKKQPDFKSRQQAKAEHGLCWWEIMR